METGTLFSAGEELVLRPLEGWRERLSLAGGAWVEVRRGWVGGADVLCDRLARRVPWQAERRRMYDRVLDVPRLQSFYGEGCVPPDAGIEHMRRALNRCYAPEAGEPFRTVGLCLYRDGSDSVAWHGDRTGRSANRDVLVAIVSLGAERRFLLRPRGGGAARAFSVTSGDLLVMGGSCQRTWEHAVPKTARPTGLRISVQFRPRDVR